MADNATLNAGSGGATLAAASLSFSGDTALVQAGAVGILSGSEDAWTYTLSVGGAGAVTAGTQRITLASDDPAVVALQIIDDWDESDRCKVNPIAGQAGVAAGAGAVAATVQRVTLASDDPAVAKLGTIDADTSGLFGCVAGTELQVDVVTVPADPFGANADAGSATGSISAKLRFIAATGIPITGTVTVGSHAVTNAGTFAVQAAQSGTWTVDLGATDNAVLDAIAASLAGTLTVGSHAVTNAGTFAVQAVCTNAGTFVVQVDGAALTALQVIDNPVLVDDAAFTPATSSVMMAGFEADESSTDSVDEGDAGAARMTLDRKVIVTDQPHTAGGLSIHRSIDLDEGALEVVKASPGQIYGMWVANTATATRFIKFYDATSGTAGTGTPVLTIPIPGNSSDDIAGVFNAGGKGIAFATGICVGATTGVADNDTGAPGANDCVVNIFFK